MRWRRVPRHAGADGRGVTRRVHPVRRLLVIVLAALLAAPILVPRGSVPAVLAQERSSAELERELDEQQRERNRVAD